jgi:DNA-binding transcriptional regulator YiaG
MSTGYVYAIRSGEAVKIGWATDPARRLSELNVGSPVSHELLGVVPATKAQERELHLLLKPWRVRGEWFDGSAKPVVAFISMLRKMPVRAQREPRTSGNALKDWRERNGLTLRQFAEIVGSSPSLLSRIENGDARPSVPTLAALQRATNGAVSASDFIGATQ